MSEQRHREPSYDLVSPATGTRISVHEGEDEDEALARATRTDPELRARADRLAARRASGEPGIPAEALYARLGYTPSSGQDYRPTKGERGRKGTPNGGIPLRVPVSIHKDLVARAKQEGVSVNQLILAYIARGLGYPEQQPQR
jgi:hypothetical protein